MCNYIYPPSAWTVAIEAAREKGRGASSSCRLQCQWTARALPAGQKRGLDRPGPCIRKSSL